MWSASRRPKMNYLKSLPEIFKSLSSRSPSLTRSKISSSKTKTNCKKKKAAPTRYKSNLMAIVFNNNKVAQQRSKKQELAAQKQDECFPNRNLAHNRNMILGQITTPWIWVIKSLRLMILTQLSNQIKLIWTTRSKEAWTESQVSSTEPSSWQI